MSGHTQNILVAVLLFVLGEKSITIAKLGLYVFDTVTGSDTKPGAEFEIAMFGLAFGTAAAVLVATSRKDRDANDNLTIFIGVLTASIAGLLSIGEAAFDPDTDFGTYPRQALFFFCLWLIVVIFPSFTGVLRGEGLETKVLRCILCALLVGAAFGFAFQLLSGVLITNIQQPSGQSDVKESLRDFAMQPAAVTALGAAFVAAACSPIEKRSWFGLCFMVWPQQLGRKET